MGEKVIEVKNLVKQYGSRRAVDDLSFTVEKGQIIGLLGPNGAGKSTTMNIITGYISATEGTVTIDGHDILEEPEKAKKLIGYLPEIPPVYPDMTVLEYLKFAAEIKGVKKDERSKMIEDIMEMTKITPMSKRLIKQLSKGYRQRVGLAGAIMGYPELIILDEPTVGLDPMQIIEIRDLIKELSKEHTVILSSHILSEVSAVCDEVIIMNKGKLVISDTTENLSKHMSGTSRLHLVVKGVKEKLEEILSTIEDIGEITYEETEEEGCIAFTAESEIENDIREELFYALSKGECPIYEMQITRRSLEDIFLALTTDQEELEIEEDNENQGDSAEETESQGEDSDEGNI